MILPPSELRKWPGLRGLLRWLNDLRSFAIAARPISGPRCNVYSGANGSLLDPLVKSGMGGAVEESFAPLALVKTTDGTEAANPRIRVVASTVAGFEPAGFSPGDDPEFLLVPEGAAGYVWAGINLSQETGELSDPWIDIGTAVPVDTDTEFYCLIGSYVMTDGQISAVSNLRYGPITAEKCRLWWAGSSPYYGLSFA